MAGGDNRAVALRRATDGDIAFIMAAERTPAYLLSVGRWDEPRHRAAMASDDFAYFVGLNGVRLPRGFAILRGLNDPSGNILLQRIVAIEADRGFGTPLLTAVVDWTFGETGCHRLWLSVFTDNPRARHVYKSLGFVEEGLMREVVLRPDGSRADQVVMSLLRREWRAEPS